MNTGTGVWPDGGAEGSSGREGPTEFALLEVDWMEFHARIGKADTALDSAEASCRGLKSLVEELAMDVGAAREGICAHKGLAEDARRCRDAVEPFRDWAILLPWGKAEAEPHFCRRAVRAIQRFFGRSR